MLNKTDKINFTAISGQYINYIYDAGGSVMEKQQYTGGSLTATTIYKDGFVFINGTLSYFTMPEGRVLNNSGTLSQQFIITDQQGNARITFDNSGTGGTAKVLQENSYYAFGMVMAGSPVAAPAVPNKNLYNGGSEWQNDYTNQPDVYQTFNRNYDAAIGRFLGVDPEPESAESMTNYQYAENNPVMFNDPGGDLIKTPGLSEGIPSYYNTISGMQNAGPSLIDGDPNEGPDNGPIGLDIYADRLAGAFDEGGGSTFGTGALSALNDILAGISSGILSFSGENFAQIVNAENTITQNPGTTGQLDIYADNSISLNIQYLTASTGTTLDGSSIMALTGSRASGVVGVNQGVDITSPRLFESEKAAYNFMWQNSLNSDGSAYKEVAAFITNFGVLVLPNVKNTSNSADAPYDYIGNKTYFLFDGLVLNIYGLVHTHPNGFHDYLTDPDDYDITYARGIPDFVIGRNGTVQMGVANPFTGNFSIQIGTTNNLFNGSLSLYKYISQ